MFYYLLAALAAPTLLLLDHYIAKRRRIRSYGFADTINGISHFLGEMILTVALGLSVFDAYDWLLPRVALFTPARTPLTWALSFLALDLLYWVGHRVCHRVAIFWALHAVHHQSTEYNLAAGLRGPWLSALQIAPFMVPLAVFGVPVGVLFPLYAFHTVWKLAVHTEVVPRLPIVEWVFVTPSLHRVHHGSEAAYIDRNFGGVLILWDRLFGTYASESHTPVYGLGAPLGTYDPIDHNLSGFRAIGRALDQARGKGVMAHLRAVFGAPTGELDVLATDALVATPRSGRTGTSIAFVVVAALVLGFMWKGPSLEWPARIGVATALVVALVAVNRRLHPTPSAIAARSSVSRSNA